MVLTKKEIAESFSLGAFKKTYPYLSCNVVWKVIKNLDCIGRDEVMLQCEKTLRYFASISTDFKLLDTIEQDKKVVVTGTAELSKEGKRIEFISSCDVYEFEDDNMLQKITSYCIVE